LFDCHEINSQTTLFCAGGGSVAVIHHTVTELQHITLAGLH